MVLFAGVADAVGLFPTEADGRVQRERQRRGKAERRQHVLRRRGRHQSVPRLL